MMHAPLGAFGPPLLFLLVGALWQVERHDDATPMIAFGWPGC